MGDTGASAQEFKAAQETAARMDKWAESVRASPPDEKYMKEFLEWEALDADLIIGDECD